ncbi:uncharacterized protein Fot_37028 [Forsythia ovata]|uniref:Uncharacterized protein n=1 Tax=Forsythia ovata TaxID=205694 RepID=A0ABD1SR37_9LAMI
MLPIRASIGCWIKVLIEGKINAKRQKTSSENVSAELTGPSTHNSSPPRAPSLSTSVEIVIDPVTEQSVGRSIVIEPVTEQSVGRSIVIEPVTEQSVGRSIVIEPVEHSPRTKTVVFPRSTNMPIPDGAIVKPYSDDQWVAYNVGMNQ